MREHTPEFIDKIITQRLNKLVDEYLYEKTWKVRENANTTYSLQALNFHISSEIIEKYWLNAIYNDHLELKKAHISGDFHIHDLPILGPYCVGWDLQDLLMQGFKGVPGKITSKPAKHFRSALGQVVNFFFTLQGEAAGAQAFSNFDTYLAPFIKYDHLNYKQVKQSLQEFLFNINIPTRVGFQSPFTNITLDLKVPKFMKDEPVTIGGKIMDAPRSDFQKEMDIFNKALFELMEEGDGTGRVFTFPIPTINITKDFDWKSEVSESLFRMTNKFGIPYFANFVNSDLNPEDVRSMCCHLRLDKRELKKRGGGLFGANPLTGSIGVVTINMPRIGYLSKTEDEFIERLEKLMLLSKKALEIKRGLLEKLTTKGLYPYSRFYLRNIKKRYKEYWKNHFNTIGLVGMNEACLNFLGEGLENKNALDFSIKILEYMRRRLQDFQEETGEIFNLEATPAEGASYRLAKLDKEKYPKIIVANEKYLKEGRAPFYTNSSQLPVDLPIDVFDALSLQESLQILYTGGTVFHVYLGEKLFSWKSTSLLVKQIVKSSKIPYFTLTPTFSICPNHGYMSGKHYKCPICGSKCEVYSRVVGYLRPIDQWNDGKQSEFDIRETFDRTSNLG